MPRPEKRPKKIRPPSLADVAALAGVSKMTVSRVVNRDPRVSAQTVAAVTKAQAAIGFVPKSSEVDGRRLRSRSRVGLHQGRIATLIPDTRLLAMQTILTGRLMSGIDAMVNVHRIQQVVTRLPEPHTLPHFFNRRQIDGVIIRDGYDSQWIIDGLKAQDIPGVWIYADGPTLAKDAVLSDNPAMARLAFEYFQRQGIAELVIIDDVPAHPAHRTRIATLLQLAGVAGIPHRHVTVAQNGEGVREWAPSISAAIGQAMVPVGVFVPGTYDIAQTAMQVVAERRGAGVRAELVTCSFDAHLIDMAPCPMANIETHPESIGEAAVELLLWRLAEPSAPARHVTIQPSLVLSAVR